MDAHTRARAHTHTHTHTQERTHGTPTSLSPNPTTHTEEAAVRRHRSSEPWIRSHTFERPSVHTYPVYLEEEGRRAGVPLGPLSAPIGGVKGAGQEEKLFLSKQPELLQRSYSEGPPQLSAIMYKDMTKIVYMHVISYLPRPVHARMNCALRSCAQT